MGRAIMIVGNADIDSRHARQIDGADLVIRFNDCRSAGPGGTKTDVVAVCNTGRPGRRMLKEPEWAANPQVDGAAEIWATRDPAKFAALKPALAATHPALDDFCDDYTDGFRAFAAASGKRFRALSAARHEALDRTLLNHGGSGHIVPSTGALVVAEVLANVQRPDDDLALAGFGHEGWEFHPWSAERAWMNSLVATGALRRLDP